MKCQLRLCSHTLVVETGRWGHYTPREERICTLCGEGVEDAEHFAVHCSEQKELFGKFVSTARGDVSRIVRLSQPPTEAQRAQLFALMMSDDCPSGMETEQWRAFESKVYFYLACAKKSREARVAPHARSTNRKRAAHYVRNELNAKLWPHRPGDEE